MDRSPLKVGHQPCQNDTYSDRSGRYYISAPQIVVRGKPSSELAERLQKEEKERVEAQVKKLGPEGLAELEKKLESAKAEHEQPIPEDMLTSFHLPSVKGISWISVQSAKNTPVLVSNENKGQHPIGNSELQKHLAQDSTSLPMAVQFDHVSVRRVMKTLIETHLSYSPNLLLCTCSCRFPSCLYIFVRRYIPRTPSLFHSAYLLDTPSFTR